MIEELIPPKQMILPDLAYTLTSLGSKCGLWKVMKTSLIHTLHFMVSQGARQEPPANAFTALVQNSPTKQGPSQA